MYFCIFSYYRLNMCPRPCQIIASLLATYAIGLLARILAEHPECRSKGSMWSGTKNISWDQLQEYGIVSQFRISI